MLPMWFDFCHLYIFSFSMSLSVARLLVMYIWGARRLVFGLHIYILHCRSALQVYENDHAVRVSEIATSLKHQGKGSNRRWTPNALLRTAFGHTAVSSIKSKLLSKSPCVYSINSAAYWMKSSTTHIAQDGIPNYSSI